MSDSTIPVGIDGIRLDGGTLVIPYAEIARCRDYPMSALQAVQFSERSTLQPWEDPVTLAVNAAYGLIDDPEAFGLLVVGTESGLDFGKPLSTYVHKALKLSTRCKNFEIKHACYGGTAALRLACDWAQSLAANGRKALVITTDVARRHDSDVSELTAGNGAIAMSICAEPRFLQIDPLSGVAADETYDVARPTAASEWVDPVLSLASYMDLLELAWEDYETATGATIDQFRLLAYHCPLVSLVEGAHALHMEIAAPDGTPDEVSASLTERVLPGMRYNRRLGNIYSGSLYASLLGLIESSAPAPGDRVGCFSYGSGACAEFFAGRTTASSQAAATAADAAAHLDARCTVDYDTYLRLLDQTEAQLVAQELTLRPTAAATQRLALTEIRNHHRQYEWV